MNRKKQPILWFNELTNKDVPLVGGKNASLGEMYRFLTKKGVKIPNGFALTASAYWYFLEEAGIKDKIKQILKGLDTHNIGDLMKRGAAVRAVILKAQLPSDLKKEIHQAYAKLCKFYGMKNVDVAVRSSATAEDLPDASFAGQQETYLNVRGEAALVTACRKCIASLFTNRAISYRVDKGFDHFKIALSVGVQKMVRSDLASSGVMFTVDTESGFDDAILINSSYGLGENVVKGVVNPDEYYVFETTLDLGYKPIIGKTLGSKEMKLVYNFSGKNPTKNVKVSPKDRQQFCLKDSEVLKLAKWSRIIEKHYKRSMDCEWAKDGRDNKLYIVQARPETVHSVKDKNVLEEYVMGKKGKVLVTGDSVGFKIGQGKVHVIYDVKNIKQFKDGEVLVTDMTDPDWEPAMKKAAAIVTDSGGRTCHAAIVSRELGIPCIVGSETATKALKNNMQVTVSCAEGQEGYVYSGLLPYKVKKTNLKSLKKPKTKVMMNVGEPDLAFSASFIPNEGVGLAREEFIINSTIKAHPLALINYNKLKDKKVKKQIDKISVGYKSKTQFYVEKLSEGIGRIAAAFYPKDVIVRLSDFKSDEYANLIGGKEYEPEEFNPMLGWRGASRYYSEKFRPAFDMECKALTRVRDVMGLKNVKIMVPFCRTIEEAKKVLEIMAKNGLVRGKDGLEMYVMVEIPANIVLGEEFAKHFDGFSIGTNDLTQGVLMCDRNSELVSHIYDERNQAVKDSVSQIIQIARKTKTKIGICGQAPSDFPDFAAFLVQEGIDSISLIPDTVIKTTLRILVEEKRRRKSGKQKRR